MGKYGAETQVPADRSRAEIEKTLTRYGADNFGYVTSRDAAAIAFVSNGRQVRFVLSLPDPAAREFARTPSGHTRSEPAAKMAYQQAVRQRWRALALVVKSKLEAVESGIVTFEQEFAAHVVLSDGRTVFEHIAPAIAADYAGLPSGPLLAIGRGSD